jgi:hypothetical protein
MYEINNIMVWLFVYVYLCVLMHWCRGSKSNHFMQGCHHQKGGECRTKESNDELTPCFDDYNTRQWTTQCKEINGTHKAWRWTTSEEAHWQRIKDHICCINVLFSFIFSVSKPWSLTQHTHTFLILENQPNHVHTLYKGLILDNTNITWCYIIGFNHKRFLKSLYKSISHLKL